MANNTKSRPGTFHKTKSHGKGNQSALKSKANAASGYARRQSAKDKKRSQNIGDVYEYEQDAAPRRSKVRLELDRDEEQEFGGLDDMDDAQRDNLRARLIGEGNDDDERVASEDDEEIDSDCCRYAEVLSRKGQSCASSRYDQKRNLQKKQKDRAVRFADVDLNEDDDVPIQQQKDSGKKRKSGDDDEFIDLLGVLDGKGEIDMPSDDEPTTGDSPKPTTARIDQNSDVEMEGEEEEDEEDDDEVSGDEDIRITASDDEDDLAKGNLDDLQSFVESLDIKSQKRKADDEGQPVQRRKRRMIREVTETGAEDEFRVTTSGDAKLNLDDFLGPLSGQSSALQTLKKTNKILEKLDREAAYEQTKEEVDKWNNTMRRIREGRASEFSPASGETCAVDSLLKSAGVREDELAETEEGILKANNLSVEEVAERRAELRKMRELMYRAEVKAKRVKKIKSKTADQDEDARMKRETERARERATLRHKHTGKWARQMRQGHMNEDQRKEIEEMLDKGEKLRRRVQGVASDEDEDEELDPEEAMRRIKAATFDELQQLKEGGNADGEPMKFMKDAMARQNAAANREADDFLNELVGVVVQRVGGRTTYRPEAVVGLSFVSSDIHLPDLLPTATIQAALAVSSMISQTGSEGTTKVVVNKDSKSADKSKNKLKKEQRKRRRTNVLQLDQVAEQSPASIVIARLPEKEAASSKLSIAKSNDGGDDDDDSDVNSEQRDLVAQAFAGDNVVREFEEAKRREIGRRCTKRNRYDTRGLGILGWGRHEQEIQNKKSHRRPDLIKKVAGADYNRANIIISEKRDKKAAKYLVKDLPYPYTRAMERPIWAQWNTRMAFQRGTLPRVVKKVLAAIITPLTKAT
ncbi:Utp14-domain-containing protein [Coprinopsis sp. MPI-PUGE-AT-0042]|nr:Utp14-domain-containing protein [Coprinopsis sp. MPI-PUGE-AT-0042]